MELNYKSFGSGYPLIILHGLFGMLDNWKSIGVRLSDHFTIIIIDQRNHGKSFHHPEMDFHLLAKDLKDFMETQWIFEAFILGHSMGGKVAMQLALEYPDLASKLVVVDIAPKKYLGEQDKLMEIMLGTDPGTYTRRKELLSELDRQIGDDRVLKFLSKNVKRNKQGTYYWQMNLSSIQQNYQNLLAPVEGGSKYERPALFVKGADSNYITAEDEDLIKSYFPNACFKTVDGAGHWVHVDSPDQLTHIVHDFLMAN